MSNIDYFGKIGMALSCTIFLEGGLKKYKKYTALVDADMLCLIGEWNKILLSLLKNGKYRLDLGRIGNKLLKRTPELDSFVPRCIEECYDISVQSLHYALRFQESALFLDNKIKQNKNLIFCDLGCGLSPLGAVFQLKYNLPDVYCVDVAPEIADLYTEAAYKLGGKLPSFVGWDVAKRLAKKDTDVALNTVVSVGCLPHMNLDTQKRYLHDINNKFENFFVEIKYKQQDGVRGEDNAFSLYDLQKLRLDVENVNNIETAVIRNAIKYLRRFIKLKDNRKDFLEDNSRSLFLSR